MEKCMFCDTELAPGSEEHVFLSALGGRISTYRATCQACNNAFASDETGKIDDALAESFKEIRNGLKIWSGRKAPPPTLLKAGTMQNGAEFDLAPGFVPIMRPGRIPGQITLNSEHQLSARDEADAKRMLDILSKRGLSAKVGAATRVQQKAPQVHFRPSFDGPKVWRCVAKTAVVGFVVLYGNEQARAFISSDLRSAIRTGTPPINNFAGWDFTNEWPRILKLEPHLKTPDAQPSGFEHSLSVADVGDVSVAYVTIFGYWKFSVVLGSRTGLPARGLAVNPRSTTLSRFIVNFIAPQTYNAKSPSSFSSEHTQITQSVSQAFNSALSQWSTEAHDTRVQQIVEEMETELLAAGEDESRRATVIGTFARKLAVVEHGGAWESELNLSFNEDKGTPEATD